MDLTTMQRACAATESIVDQVTPADYGLATPCTEWTVHDLLNHLIGTLHLGAALLSGNGPAVNMVPGEVPADDLVGDDPVKAYRIGVEALLAAANAEDPIARTIDTPLGPMPGGVLVGFTTLDIVVHGWDVARALGNDTTLDSGLAEDVLSFARVGVTDDNRGVRIGPEITVDPAASPTDRLVGYLGRRP
jgi:uncharacterized protein (TIGR03086 family)